MDNIYQTIISNDLYLIIALVLATFLIFSIIKKLFKVAIFVSFCGVVLILYIMVKNDVGPEEAINQAGQMFEEAKGQAEGVLHEMRDKAEGVLDDVKGKAVDMMDDVKDRTEELIEQKEK